MRELEGEGGGVNMDERTIKTWKDIMGNLKCALIMMKKAEEQINAILKKEGGIDDEK